MRGYYVYILASHTRVLYVGMTGSLDRRIIEHKDMSHEGFTSRYRVIDLVYYESYQYVKDAIAREKELKGWRREKKIALIESTNRGWRDPASMWYKEFKQNEAALAALQEEQKARNAH